MHGGRFVDEIRGVGGVRTRGVLVFGGFANVFPGEVGAETRDFGFVVANEEDEVVGGDGAGAAARGELGALQELGGRLGRGEEAWGRGGGPFRSLGSARCLR